MHQVKSVRYSSPRVLRTPLPNAIITRLFVLNPTHRRLSAIVPILVAALLTGCGTPPSVPASPPSPALHRKDYASFDHHTLPYQSWLPDGKTKLIVVGFHGISGASNDMENLGLHLPRHLPGTAVYAPDLRGQGNDPITGQRGDIRTPNDWYEDARTFTALLRRQHPGVPVVWCGESMGALIALHACASDPGSPPPCDALILASPVSSIGGEISPVRRILLRIAATLFPRHRVSLEALAGVDQVQITRDEVHEEQSTTNPWHIPAFTLRLLRYLEGMITHLSDQATTITIPTLILHGGRDIFSDPAAIERFASRFPPEARLRRHYYPGSYHLLFYDHQREEVLRDTTNWLRDLHLAK